jgi:hypothetical protein
LNPEAEGLRLRYTGADVPPTNNPSGVAWRYHVRGNFVATAQYEVLKCEPPSRGTFDAGVELYLRLDNPTSDAITVARGVYPNGSAAINFKVLTNDGKGKRISRDYKLHPTTDKSLRGRLRLARTGSIVTASFAEGDEGPFTEFQRTEISAADIRLVRIAGIAGGDRNAVLDLRILEFQVEGEALALEGRFATPIAKADVSKAKDVPKAKDDAAHAIAEDRSSPVPEPGPERWRSFVRLAVVFSLFMIAVLVTVGIVLRSRRRKAGSTNHSGGRRIV